ncbi:MAG: DUF2029 domain-containing protein, partial [Beijerinckiaceae bacterium]
MPATELSPSRVFSLLTPFMGWSLLGAAGLFLIIIGLKQPEFFATTARPLTDFDAHYIAGQLALRGELAKAYGLETLLPLQKLVSAQDNFMPWAYPPPFHLLLAPLALAPP